MGYCGGIVENLPKHVTWSQAVEASAKWSMIFLHCLWFLTDLPLNLSRCSFTITVSSVLIVCCSVVVTIKKGSFVCQSSMWDVQQQGTNDIMLIPTPIIWQSPLFCIASAHVEPRQNAHMGESEAFLLTTQPHARQDVKTTIVTWLGMDRAGGNAAWDPSPPPRPENHGQW